MQRNDDAPQTCFYFSWCHRKSASELLSYLSWKGPQVQQMELIPVEDFVMEVRGWKKHAFSTA